MIDGIKENEKDIINYIKEKTQLKENEIKIEYEKLLGFSNFNYIVIIKDKLNDKILGKYVYRKFGNISLEYDKKMEIIIIKYLYSKGLGPNILYEDKKYRISEYLYDCKNLDLDHLFDDYIIDTLCKILNIYNSICYNYSYKFINDEIILKKIDNKENRISYENTHYNNLMTKFYKTAVNKFGIFAKKFNENLSKNMEYNKYFQMINNLFHQFKELYKSNIPSNGLMVLNHNDCFSLNIMMRQKDKKLFLIDNEYASLNPLGYDIAYYICESHFNYENLYNFSFPLIDIDKCFNEYYMKYINIFLDNNITNIQEYKELIGKIKTKQYYLKLTLLVNLFLFVFVLCSIDYESWEKDKNKYFYFISGVYRVNLYNYFKNKLTNIK